MKNILIIISAITLLPACSTPKNEGNNQQTSEENLSVKADELAHKFIITDGHIDLPYRLRHIVTSGEELPDLSQRNEEGDIDYVRAKEGGLDAPFMSIYIPSSYQQTGGAKELADTLINSVVAITNQFPEKFALANTPADVMKNFELGKISLPMGMENGAPIEDDLANVAYFRQRGISYITLTHAKDNQICDSSYDTTRTWNGLSNFGELVIAEMNKQGIMIDISHVSDSAFYEVIKLTKAPVIASHSSCRKFTPGLERNMSDDMIKKLADNGGVIQINFGTFFLDSEVQAINDQNRDSLNQLLEEKGLTRGDSTAQPIIDTFKKDHPQQFADVTTVADHIEHVVNIAGVDYVGLGSDYDGVGDSLPTGLKDVSMYPNLIHELLKRGFSEEDIEKICYKNVWRVWNKVVSLADAS